MQTQNIQPKSFELGSMKMKKFAIREAETVKTTAPAAYPIWLCIGL
ncbi:hypothetical protein [Halotia branconii]|uniref:Uncharacterized protein n=1 Tax=Halotia branconii CENA392 TaxID=1539056 RepID=A0AAJ6P888_9CYAN|nr:hypothetical protein [Halotia branconii]WGV24435.1 hypothetical protein QI031_22020 [Halotia branconii CENA392]